MFLTTIGCEPVSGLTDQRWGWSCTQIADSQQNAKEREWVCGEVPRESWRRKWLWDQRKVEGQLRKGRFQVELEREVFGDLVT